MAVALFGAIVCSVGVPVSASPPYAADEEIVARVNGITISKGEVRCHVELYERAHPGLAPEWRGQRALAAARTLADVVLLEELGRELSISVSDAEVETKYAEFRGPTEEGIFQAALEFQGNNPTKLRRDIRKGLLDSKIKARLMASVAVTESDLRAKFQEEKATLYPEQAKVREIIVLTYDLAMRLHKELIDGADFAQLAQSSSTDKSRKNGGDLGWLAKRERYAPFDDIVFKLKPGEMSKPFRSPHGYHIVKVEGYRAEGWGRFEDKREVLDTQIRAFRAEREKERRMEGLHKAAKIWIADRIDLDLPSPSQQPQRG